MRVGLRADDDRGATIVEFAIVVPVLILITFAIFEFGLAFYEYLTVERATNEGARTAAFMGTDPTADCVAVGAAAVTLTADMVDRIDRIEVYRADADGNQLGGQTNTWTVDTSDTGILCGGVHWNVAEAWAPTDRQTEAPLDGGDPQLDLLGVRVVVERQWVTSFGPFSGTYDINETSLIRVEPELYQDP